MNVTRTERVSCYLLVEVEDLSWDFYYRVPLDRIIFCGEIEQVKWIFHQVASRVLARQYLDFQLSDFARRVGVEYHPIQRYTAAETHGNPKETP